jgi:hypothetical protein
MGFKDFISLIKAKLILTLILLITILIIPAIPIQSGLEFIGAKTTYVSLGLVVFGPIIDFFENPTNINEIVGSL